MSMRIYRAVGTLASRVASRPTLRHPLRMRVTTPWMMIVVFGGRTDGSARRCRRGQEGISDAAEEAASAPATRISESRCAATTNGSSRRQGGAGHRTSAGGDESQSSMPSNTHSSIDRVITASSAIIVIFAVSARHAAWQRAIAAA
jgi:hypothetical protein